MEIIDTATLLRFVAALIFVLGLMGVLALVMKRFNHGKYALSSKNRRLKIIENLPVDARRRLVLCRCDETDHLILIGPQGDQVIAANIPQPPASMSGSDEAAGNGRQSNNKT